MKILVVSNLFPPKHIGGYEIACREVVEDLESRGHEVAVLTSDYQVKSGWMGKRIRRRLRLTESWFNDYQLQDKALTEEWNQDVLNESVDDFQPDVIYSWSIHYLGLLLWSRLEKSPTPCVQHVMDTGRIQTVKSLSALERWWRGKNLSIQNGVFISRYILNRFKDSPIPLGKTRIIYPGVDTELINPKKQYGLAGKEVRVVYLGQITAHKGVANLIHAVGELNRDHDDFKYFLDIYGEGDPTYVKTLQNGSDKKITWHKNVRREDIFSRLSGYDVGVFPSLWEEPFGIAQLELMAAGLPLITTATGGAGEVAKDNQNCLSYPWDDVKALVSTISRLVDNYDRKAKKLGESARKTVEEDFSKEITFNQIEKVLLDSVQ